MIVPPVRLPKMARKLTRIAAIIAVPLLLVVVFLPRFGRHRTVIKAYFNNAMGLRAGAPVRLAGVDIGAVKSVQAIPELKQFPVEVVMRISTPYDLRIPQDSAATLETAGVLGETYVDINAAAASGPPIGTGGTLKTIAVVQMSTQEIVQKITDAIGRAQSACKPSNNCSGADAVSGPPNSSR
jgi:phospholipid/cholesterol/gamma-HCH transport system substrate-binding protein